MNVQDNPRTPPKVIDLSNELLSHGAIEALADVLSVDFGLKKLILESCGLDDEVRCLTLSLPDVLFADLYSDVRRAYAPSSTPCSSRVVSQLSAWPTTSGLRQEDGSSLLSLSARQVQLSSARQRLRIADDVCLLIAGSLPALS
jgi:hypothetical protein